MIIKLLMLGIWMVLVPWGIGYFALRAGRKNTVEAGYAFCLGYILMWAFFQLIAVPVIIKEGEFVQVEFAFEAVSLTFAFAGLFLFVLQLKGGLWENWRRLGGETLKIGKIREKAVSLLLWAVFGIGLLFQMAQAYLLAYADGDDAFYIPISLTASQGGSLYKSIPYTGETCALNLRYGLAPFPVWVGFIAAKCRVNAAVAAHSLIPLVLIPVTYVLYLEIGKRLCSGLDLAAEKGRRPGKEVLLPLFMIFVTLLQIFGNYSIYPASTFLLTRTRQGKAALGNVILPFFILLLHKMAEEVKEQGKARGQNVLWLMAAMTAGCLCSTMSGFLCSMLVMLTVFLIFLLHRKPFILLQGFLGCVPGIVYALLYLKL